MLRLAQPRREVLDRALLVGEEHEHVHARDLARPRHPRRRSPRPRRARPPEQKAGRGSGRGLQQVAASDPTSRPVVVVRFISAPSRLGRVIAIRLKTRDRVAPERPRVEVPAVGADGEPSWLRSRPAREHSPAVAAPGQAAARAATSGSRTPESALRLKTSTAPDLNAAAYTLAPSDETATPSGALNARPSEQPTAST